MFKDTMLLVYLFNEICFRITYGKQEILGDYDVDTCYEANEQR